MRIQLLEAGLLQRLLPVLCSLLLLGGSVQAAPLVLYENGTFTGGINALRFNNGLQVSDSFNLASAAQAVSVQFATWTDVATPTTRLDWIISTQQAAAGFGTIQRVEQQLQSTHASESDGGNLLPDLFQRCDPGQLICPLG